MAPVALTSNRKLPWFTILARVLLHRSDVILIDTTGRVDIPQQYAHLDGNVVCVLAVVYTDQGNGGFSSIDHVLEI